MNLIELRILIVRDEGKCRNPVSGICYPGGEYFHCQAGNIALIAHGEEDGGPGV